MNYAYFLSVPGERHEDHVPLGIFTSVEHALCALELAGYFVADVVKECSNTRAAYDADEELIAYIYTVPVNEYRPVVLDT